LFLISERALVGFAGSKGDVRGRVGARFMEWAAGGRGQDGRQGCLLAIKNTRDPGHELIVGEEVLRKHPEKRKGLAGKRFTSDDSPRIGWQARVKRWKRWGGQEKEVSCRLKPLKNRGKVAEKHRGGEERKQSCTATAGGKDER